MIANLIVKTHYFVLAGFLLGVSWLSLSGCKSSQVDSPAPFIDLYALDWTTLSGNLDAHDPVIIRQGDPSDPTPVLG